jgi:hypothetical protein
VSCDRSETVDDLVGCVNTEKHTHFPRESELPPESTIHALYASPIARFERKPGYLYWGVVGKPWTVYSDPVPLTVDTAVVYVTGPALGRPRGLRSRLRALVPGRSGRNRLPKGAASWPRT